MSAQTDRIVKIESLLRRNCSANFQTLLDVWETYPATIKRNQAFLMIDSAASSFTTGPRTLTVSMPQLNSTNDWKLQVCVSAQRSCMHF